MKIKISILILILTQTIYSLANTNNFNNIIFVSHSASGNNSGATWDDAFTDLQSALSLAISGDEIWVAQGTYFPSADTIRTATFSIPNGVKLYGGFIGNESTITQRDFEINETILSGDIGLLNIPEDNVYTVVSFENTNSETTLDGFIIKDGFANNNEQFVLLTDPLKSGAGIYINNNSSPSIKNCILSNNYSKFYGGGIFKNGLGNPLIQSCNFLENTCNFSGAAIYFNAGSHPDSLQLLKNNTFQNNTANQLGNAFYFNGIQGGGEMVFDSCNFLQNIGFSTIHFESPGANVSLKIKDSHFEENSANNINDAFGIIYYNKLGEVTSDSLFQIQNCSFFNNEGIAIHSWYIPYLPSQTQLPILKIDNCNFKENSGDRIIFGDKINIFLQNSTFEENHNTCLISNSKQGCEKNLDRVTNCSFIRNNDDFPDQTNTWFYGGLFRFGSRYEISNSLFVENSFSRGGIIRDFNPSQTPSLISNSTFYNNQAELGGILFSDGEDEKSLDIVNSIFVNNTATTQGDFGFIEDYFGGGQTYHLNISHCLISNPDCSDLLLFESPSTGILNCGDQMFFDTDPLFRNIDSLDFSLRSCSPVLNQGDNLVVDTLDLFFDINGNPRFLDNAVDLGAYETQAFQIYTPQVQNITCNGDNDGAILWAQHGTPPFVNNWDSGLETGTDFNNLVAGNYNVTVTDTDNCIGNFNSIITEPMLIEISGTVNDASSSTATNGSIELTIQGGTPSYEFLWSNGDSTLFVENLLPGIYSVTIVDSNGCEMEQEFEVGTMTSSANLRVHELTISSTLISTQEGTWLSSESKNKKYIDLIILKSDGSIVKKESISFHQKHLISLPSISGQYFIQTFDRNNYSRITFKVQVIQ